MADNEELIDLPIFGILGNNLSQQTSEALGFLDRRLAHERNRLTKQAEMKMLEKALEEEFRLEEAAGDFFTNLWGKELTELIYQKPAHSQDPYERHLVGLGQVTSHNTKGPKYLGTFGDTPRYLTEATLVMSAHIEPTTLVVAMHGVEKEEDDVIVVAAKKSKRK